MTSGHQMASNGKTDMDGALRWDDLAQSKAPDPLPPMHRL